jgi:hypothetical protein
VFRPLGGPRAKALDLDQARLVGRNRGPQSQEGYAFSHPGSIPRAARARGC